jgi:hypothetical protein
MNPVNPSITTQIAASIDAVSCCVCATYCPAWVSTADLLSTRSNTLPLRYSPWDPAVVLDRSLSFSSLCRLSFSFYLRASLYTLYSWCICVTLLCGSASTATPLHICCIVPWCLHHITELLHRNSEETKRCALRVCTALSLEVFS